MTTEYSIQKMVSDGTLSTIALGIQYLQRNDIYMRVAGEETPQSGAPSGYTWSFLDNTTLKILPVVPNGVEVVVYRRTDIDAMYNIYSQNAQFDEATIDENNQQLLYIAQEYLEQGIPGAGVDIIEFIRDDGSFTYYRIKRTDGSYSDEFYVPSAGSITKVLARESLRRSYAEVGYNLVDGSFEAGGTLVDANDVLLHEASGVVYSWGGAFPKSVSANTDPTPPGSGYTPRDRALLRDQLLEQLVPLNKAVHSSTVVRPVFVRQTCTTTNNSAVVSVQDASQFSVGDNILLCAGGTQQYSGSINVQGSPARSGTIYMVLDGYLISNIAVLASDTAAVVAAKLRAVTVSGWTVSGSGTTATFTKNVPGVTVGAFISDTELVGLPYTESVSMDPTFNQISKITAINTSSNTVTIDHNAQYTGSGLCYLEHGKALSAATQNGTVSIVMDGGEYLFHDGLKFTSDFTGIIGGLNGDITIYVIGGEGVPVIECEKPSAGEAYYGNVVNNIFIDMQNARRPGIVGRRLWDTSSWNNVLVDRVHPSFAGVSVRRHSSQPAPTTANDQTVVSQSVCMRGVHAISRSPMAGTPIYMEYVQEANLDNVKGVFAADFNSVALAGTTSVGVQLEACRGIVGNNMSAAGAKYGVVVTSITGESRGITLTGPTLETNENNVDIRGGAYDIFDINITNPRTIGGGTGKFKVQRLTRGRIECGDRPIDIAVACKGVHGIVDGAAAAANAGSGCYITRTAAVGTNVTAHAYPSGLSLSCGGNRVDLLPGSFDLLSSGSKVVGVDYPLTQNETALVLMANNAGTQVLSRVLIGPVDSAQNGFRVLRILN